MSGRLLSIYTKMVCQKIVRQGYAAIKVDSRVMRKNSKLIFSILDEIDLRIAKNLARCFSRKGLRLRHACVIRSAAPAPLTAETVLINPERDPQKASMLASFV